MAATRRTKRPSEVRIRAYNVGFGDCFLLTFRYPVGDRHLLMDFGSTALPRRSGPGSMVRVAEQIRTDTGGKLHVVVATHRHADHISGFAGTAGDVIASLEPELVVQPWTEHPDLATDATAPSSPRRAARSRGRSGGKGLAATAAVSRLADMHELADYVREQGVRMAAVAGVPKRLSAQLAFLGEENLLNRPAVEALQSLGRKQVYASFGARLPIASLLPGVKVDVLGPPTVQQAAGIRRAARTDPDEFWHLAASTARARRGGGGGRLFPDAPVARQVPQEARWLIPQIDRMHAEELLSLVRILDDALNNTSLILLFDVAGTRLLFPGDAQVESWRYALRDAPEADEIRARLATAVLYKVGHHGSLNATPRKLLWDAFQEARTDPGAKPLVTLLSTLAGKHGSETRGTEVPRDTLVEALRDGSELHTTEEGTTSAQFWRDLVFPLGGGDSG